MTDAAPRRIGLLIPSSSSTQEPEFARVLPSHVTVHAARLPLTQIRDDQTARLVDDIELEAKKLADCQVDVIALPATAPSSRKGQGGDQELIKRIKDASGVPATTASTAMLEVLQVLGKRKIAIGAPWSHAVNQKVAAFLTQNGYEVVDAQELGHEDNLTVGRLDEQSGLEMGRKVKSQDADVVLLACGNWRTMGVIERLEQELGKTVVTTNQVTLWAALRSAGGVDRIEGAGSLLRDHLTARRSAAAE
jgi:maleate cis-trans isomerase